MDGLRLILLVIGLLLLAGVYWWSTAARRRNRPRRAPMRGRRLREPLEPLGISPQAKEGVDFAGTLTNLGEMISEERKGGRWRRPISRALSLGRRLGGRGRSEPHAARQGEEGGSRAKRLAAAGAPQEVLILYLTAPPEDAFSGPAIREAAERCGMRFGARGVFYHHGVGEMLSESGLFCLANMFEPGSFDLARITSLKTEGLVLFMALPAPVAGSIAFELMLSTARRLRERLGGELRDAARRPLEPTEIGRMRCIAASAAA